MSEPFSLNEFPFKSHLDFKRLLTFWESNMESNSIFKNHPIQSILSNAKFRKDLQGKVTKETLEKHHDTIQILLSAVLPSALINEDIAGVHIPFQNEAFFATPKYKQILANDTSNTERISIIGTNNGLSDNCEIVAGLYILKNFYRPDLELELPIMVKVENSVNGLEKIYNLEVNTNFTDIEVVGKLPDLDKDTIDLLLNNLEDLSLWQQHLPSHLFIFKGFTIHRLTDVTAQEMLSSIKFYLLKRDAVTCGINFQTVQQKIRSLFGLPEMELGIIFFDASYNIMSNAGISNWNSFLTMGNEEEKSCDKQCCEYFEGSIYDEVFENKRAVIVEDLSLYKNPSPIETNLLKKGIKNIGIAPLINNGKILGMLELATPYPGKLNTRNASKLANVLPMFTAAIDRVLGDLQMEVRAIIQKECTSIHPSVEWKFIEEGYELIRRRSGGQKAEMKEIVFENVYPLFGMSDIRNSSVYRNTSIREDLIENLQAAGEVLTTLYHHKQMHIFNQLNFRVTRELERINEGLASGDESNILDFIKNDVNDALRVISKGEKEVRPLTKKYFNQLDPEYGVIYKRRKDFESSLTRINDTISLYMDEAEKVAQEIYPHYFEKYKTDGVEYNMYIGQSLNKEKIFDPLYLKNFRLWQLVIMCEISRKIEDLQSELSHPLEITQLILVQSEPLDIRFRKDEKHFDVDGAYNIRYEIIKKRIDKAFIKNSSERLTQPGMISIVYTHEKEENEYLKYIKYLQTMDCLTEKIEKLELEDLQGAHGLKALRVHVNKDMKPFRTDVELLRETISETLN
jgi:hypothetical protein